MMKRDVDDKDRIDDKASNVSDDRLCGGRWGVDNDEELKIVIKITMKNAMNMIDDDREYDGEDEDENIHEWWRKRWLIWWMMRWCFESFAREGVQQVLKNSRPTTLYNNGTKTITH